MANIKINTRNFARKLRKVAAGDTVLMSRDTYKKPLVLEGITGTKEHPVIIRPDYGLRTGDVVLKSDIREHEARMLGNRVAGKREQAGYYPTVGHLGEQALLILRNCQFVVVQGLKFKGCWPTGIFIDDSMYVGVRDCHFEKGSIAIVAQGRKCHDVVVEHCSWKQDKSGYLMWNRVPWDRIHGASNNGNDSGVSEDDYRYWDGDFFRAWNVHSNFTFRHNHIEDAFNGIHFFNSHDRLPPGRDANTLEFNGGRESAANVLIENNRFVRVRDNIFEPESHAWNWVIRHNTLLDCYRPFSFEFERAGWFYIYGNKGAFLNRPSGDFRGEDLNIKKSKRRRNPSLTKTKGPQKNEGPIYFFNNSWFFEKGKGLFPKFQLGKLVHVNNASQFANPEQARYFGGAGTVPSAIPFDPEKEIEAEGSRFTRRWGDFDIRMDGDVCNDVHFPDDYRALGYGLGVSSKQATASFARVRRDQVNSIADLDFTSKSRDIRKKSVELVLELPFGKPIKIDAGYNVGAVQKKNVYDRLDGGFEFIPDLDWLPQDEPEPETSVFFAATND